MPYAHLPVDSTCSHPFNPFITRHHTLLLSQLESMPYRSREVFIQIFLARQKQDVLEYTQQGATNAYSCNRGIFRVLFSSWEDTQSGLCDNSESPLPAVLPRSKPLGNKSRSKADPLEGGQVDATLFLRTRCKKSLKEKTSIWVPSQFRTKLKQWFTGKRQ